MSATIPESMRLDDLLKATGYDCPQSLQGKTFDQATEGGGAELEDNKTVSITENGVVEITPSEGKDGMKKVTATVNVSGGANSKYCMWGNKKNANVPDLGVYYSSFQGYLDVGVFIIFLKDIENSSDVSVGDELFIYKWGNGETPYDNKLVITSIDTENNTITGVLSGTTYTLHRELTNYLTHRLYNTPYIAKLRPYYGDTIEQNEIKMYYPQLDLSEYDGISGVNLSVNVPSGAISITSIDHSVDIARTVGATGSVMVTTVMSRVIGVVTNGGINSSINGKIYLTDLIALGSEGSSVTIRVGPGALVIKLTATATEQTGQYTVTGEVVSVASTYYGGAVQLLVLS